MSATETIAEHRFVVGNWKCSKNLDQAYRWFDAFIRDYHPSPGLQVVIAPPVLWMVPLAERLKTLDVPGVSLAAQDISPFPRGSYTGAIAADMLRGIGDYAIIGHDERRRYFHETSQDSANKVHEAADAGIKPIICVDTSYALSQLGPLADLDCEHLVIAYCPVETMTFREPERKEKVAEAARFIGDIHPSRPIIYGGAITPDNAGEYAGISGISGLFVGTASLDPLSFLSICQAVAR